MITREQIRAVDPGRLLDVWVAEYVLGYRRHGQPKDVDGAFGGEPVLLPPGQTWDAAAADGYVPPPRGRLPLDYFVMRYSTDIVWAWALFQDCGKLIFSKRRRFLDELGRLLQTAHGDAPLVGFIAWPDAILFLTPHRICRAALLATLPEES